MKLLVSKFWLNVVATFAATSFSFTRFCFCLDHDADDRASQFRCQDQSSVRSISDVLEGFGYMGPVS